MTGTISESAEGPGVVARRVERILAWALTALAAVLISGWGANLLSWPWWPDLDTFADLAQGWAEGDPPYKAVAAHSFPGQIYLFAVLGWVFGWGRTWPIYAVDVATLVALGVALARWSRSLSGSTVPGLVGFLAFASYYLGLGYAMVAQRDWQAAVLGSLAVLAIQARPGVRSTVVSAGLFAAGLAIRPHIVLWLPGILSALREPREPDQAGPDALAWLGRSGLWALAATAFAGLLLVPLVLNDMLGPLAANLRRLAAPSAYGGSAGPWKWLANMAGQALEFRTLGVAAGILALRAGGDRVGRAAGTWLVVLACVWWYSPISPAPHEYLSIPLRLVSAVGLTALLCLAYVRYRDRAPGLVLALTFAALAVAIDGRPAHCLFRPAVDGLRSLAAGGDPAQTPSGYQSIGQFFANYPWPDVLALRSEIKATPPGTRVANLLFRPIALNGATGRRSLLRNESGFYFSRLTRGAYRDELVRKQSAELASARPGDVVAWIPSEWDGAGLDPSLAPIRDAVRQHFSFRAKAGGFEVWGRKTSPDLAAASSRD